MDALLSLMVRALVRALNPVAEAIGWHIGYALRMGWERAPLVFARIFAGLQRAVMFLFYWIGRLLGLGARRTVNFIETQRAKQKSAELRVVGLTQPVTPMGLSAEDFHVRKTHVERNIKTAADLQAYFAAIPTAAALDYYIHIVGYSPAEFIRLYLAMVAAKDPRMDLSDPVQNEYWTDYCGARLDGCVAEMTTGIKWVQQNDPEIVLSLRRLAGLTLR